jgi:hypothetical protein
MVREGGIAQNAQVDEVIDESFPASDPPSWTLGHASGRLAEDASAQWRGLQPPPGSSSRPAPLAWTSASAGALEPLPPERLGVTAPSLETLFAAAGGLATATSVVVGLMGHKRLGRSFGRGGLALILLAIFRRLNRLIPPRPATR